MHRNLRLAEVRPAPLQGCASVHNILGLCWSARCLRRKRCKGARSPVDHRFAVVSLLRLSSEHLLSAVLVLKLCETYVDLSRVSLCVQKLRRSRSLAHQCPRMLKTCMTAKSSRDVEESSDVFGLHRRGTDCKAVRVEHVDEE